MDDDEDWMTEFDGCDDCNCDPCQCDNMADEKALNDEITQFENKHGKLTDWN